MIQRIQSVLLFLAVLANLTVYLVPLWEYSSADGRETILGTQYTVLISGAEDTAAESHMFWDHTTTLKTGLHGAFIGLVAFSSILLIVVIFLFHNRPFQIRMATIGVILLMIEVLCLVLLTTQDPDYLLGSAAQGKPAWGGIFPVLAIVLTWISIRRIRADEELVRSADRIR